MTGMMRVPRSRGALSGVLLVLLGAWGALIPFIGPYFNYAYSPDHTWTYNTGRLWLEILPGAAVFLGGLITLAAATRPAAVFGAWLAALGGAWFVVGRPLSTVWTGGTPDGGYPAGGTVSRAVENVGFFTGLGAVIIFLAAVALGRFLVIGVREATRAEEATAVTEPGTTVAEPTAADPTATRGAWEAPRADRPASGTAPQPTHGEPGTAGPTTQTDPALTADRPAGMTAGHRWGRHSAEDTEPPA
jgi:hypothetical protein